MTNPQPSPGPSAIPGVPLYGPKYQQNPAKVYEEMRHEYGPVAPILLEGDVPAWLVIGYRELHYVTNNPDLFARDSRRWNAWDRVPPDWPLLTHIAYQPSVIFAEGAEHQRRSAAISDVLAEVDQFALRSHVEKVADGLIDVFAGSAEGDLMAQYADLLPLPIVATMIGLDEVETTDMVRDITIAFTSSDDANEAFARITERMRRLVGRKRKTPGTDVASMLIAHPAALTEEELIADLLIVLIAGQLPAAYWIGNTLRLMLTDDRFGMTLAGGRRSVSQALNEVLWEDTPTQNFAGRYAVQDTQVAGKHIRKGDLLVLGLAAANNDPLVRPGAHGAETGNQAYMSFSHGHYRCPYPAQEIAEVIAGSAVEVLLDRLPDVRLAVAADALVWRPSMLMRGVSALPVTFSVS